MIYNVFFMFMRLFMITIIISSGSTADKKKVSSPPFGPFDLVFKQLYNCNPTKNNKIQHNMYIGHRGNSSWLLGNSTLEVPLDDTLFLEMKMALKDANGIWKENAFTHKTPKACSSFKKAMGNMWTPFVYGAGFKNTDCPILPGPHRFFVKQVYNCNPTQDNKIQHNYSISHRANSTVLLGNTTLDVLFDDTFFLEMNMALKDSSGKWRENVFMHTTPNACSSIKKLIGNAANAFIHGFGLQNLNCPIPPGVYLANGVYESILKETNAPKSFFYGTFKLHAQYSRKNEKFGCQVFIIEFKRP